MRRIRPGLKILSLVILAPVRRAYTDEEYALVDGTFRAFAATNREKLNEIYRAYAGDLRAPWVTQPESIAVFERLESRPNLLRQRWQESLRLDVLEQLANCWGAPL